MGDRLGLTIAWLTGLLILTRDLGITNDLFADGVTQVETLDKSTDEALDGAHQLPPATDAVNQGLPEVVAIIDSLTRADQTLATLGVQLAALGGTLIAVDEPLAGTISAGQAASEQASAAAEPLGGIAGSIDNANANVQTLGQKLNETLALSQTIDQKLRVALLLPRIGN